VNLARGMTKQVSETVVKRMLSKLDNGERIAHGPPPGHQSFIRPLHLLGIEVSKPRAAESADHADAQRG
jgi:hypothetical protein